MSDEKQVEMPEQIWIRPGDAEYSLSPLNHDSDDVGFVRADLSAPAWQSMETAPKDSSWILGAMATGRQAVVRWGGGTWEDDNRLCRDPTLWMPLPSLPTAPAVEVGTEADLG